MHLLSITTWNQLHRRRCSERFWHRNIPIFLLPKSSSRLACEASCASHDNFKCIIWVKHKMSGFSHLGFLQNTHLTILALPFFSTICIRGIGFNPRYASSSMLSASQCFKAQPFSQEWQVTQRSFINFTCRKISPLIWY